MLHTDKQYELELGQLKNLILKMGSLVEGMIASAMRSLVERNSQFSHDVDTAEVEANKLELAIDELTLQILALRQPAGSDLRFLTIALRASKDMERIGDLALNISQQARILNQLELLKPLVDLPKMALKTQEMLKLALDTFVNADATKARKVCLMDDEVDQWNHVIFNDIVELISKKQDSALRGINLILVARNLERIADHATNIAEEVIFMVEGKDIRHKAEQN